MNRLTVLIVDDSSLQRRALCRCLAAYDCETVEAENGAVALECLKTLAADLILLDYNMPVMDGLEFLRILRQDPVQNHIPVVMLTANAAPATLAAAARLRVRDYLVKPVDSALLVAKLSRLVTLRPLSGDASIRESS